MARTVGNIQVTVDADTGKLKAQLIKGGAAAGKAGAEAIERELENLQAEIDLRTEDAEAAAKLLKKQIEASLHGIEVTADMSRAREDLREFEIQVEQMEVMINGQLNERDLAEINRNIKEFKERVEADEIQFQADLTQVNIELEKYKQKKKEDEIQFQADLTQINLNIQRWREQQEADEIEFQINMRAGLFQAAAEAEHFRMLQEADDIRINFATDTAGATLAFEAWKQRMEAEGIDVDVDPDFAEATAEFHAWLKAMEADAERGGTRAGHAFGGGLGSFTDDTFLIAAAVLTLGDAIAVAFEGVASSAISVLSSAVSAVGGAAGAAAPLVAGLGAALTAVLVGSRGVFDAMGQVSEEFKNAAKEGRAVNLATGELGDSLRGLSPAARDTAVAFGEIQTELEGMRREVSQALFANMGDELRELGDDVLPDLSSALSIAGGSVNEFGHQLADAAKETDFKELVEAIDPALDDAFDAATSFIRTFEPFLLAAAPAAERLAEMLRRGAESLRLWVQNNPDEIATFLDDGVTSLERWTELLSSTADLLVTVFSAGVEQGDSFVVSLNNIIERWDAWLESTAGQEAMVEFFQRGEEALKAFEPVVEGLKTAFDELISPTTAENFASLAEAIGAALPAFAELITMVGQFQLAEAALEILSALQPVFELIQLIPDPLLEIIGTFIILTKVGTAASGAIKAIGAALDGMTKTNAVLLGIGLALSGAIALWDAFGSKQKKAAEATKELRVALENTVDSMITSGEVAAGASIGVDAFNRTLAEMPDEGKKFQTALGFLGKGVEDMRQVIVDIDKDARPALANLAEGFGLPAEAAADLAKIVDQTDQNFDSSVESQTLLKQSLERVAEASGLTFDQIVELAAALEQTQDQAENIDLEKIATQELELAAGGDEATKALLAQARATAEAAGEGDNALAVWDEFVRLQNEAANATEDSASAALDQTRSIELVGQAIDDALAAQKARNEELKLERAAAFDAYQAELQLADATAEAAVEIAAARGFSRDLAQGFVDVGGAARDAARDADAFRTALDLLLTPALDLQSAVSDMEQAFDDLNEQAFISVATVGTDWTAAMDLGTQVGRDNAAAVRDQVDAMFSYAEQALAAGESQDVVTAKLSEMRGGLEQTLVAMGATDEQARAYTDSLLGVPGLLTTVIENPGMIAALTNAETLNLLYDDAGNPVITEFEAIGLDPALADSEEFRDLVEELDKMSSDTEITATTAVPTQGEIDAVRDATDELDRSSADPEISATDIPGVQGQVDKLQRTLEKIDLMIVDIGISSPSVQGVINKVEELDEELDLLSDGEAEVRVSGVQFSIDKVRELDRELEGLRDRTVTITTVNRNRVGSMYGEMFPGSMAGEVITGPTIRNVGEKGFAEAIVPLTLPLNRVDPSVRDLAALLRGAVQTSDQEKQPMKQVNNYMTITPTSADPAAVAVQIMNRSASLANR